MIHLVASLPHYQDWLLPIADELVARDIDVEIHDLSGVLADEPIPTVIAGMGDQSVIPHCRPLALVDHGVGQTYANLDHQSYNAGRNRQRVSLFLYSTRQARDANEARWHDATHVVCGPVRLDQFFEGGVLTGGMDRPCNAQVTVGFAWHFDLTITQETRSAFGYYLPVLERLAADSPYKLLGHAHPRAWESIEGHYERLGIEQERDVDQFLTRCDVVVVDNSSVLFEAAALQRPVLALDAPFYRDTPRQPPRFYDQVPGLRLRAYRDQAPECGIVHDQWGRDHLAAAIDEALKDRPPLQRLRERVVGQVYGERLDGRASERAADAIEEWAQQ